MTNIFRSGNNYHTTSFSGSYIYVSQKKQNLLIFTGFFSLRTVLCNLKSYRCLKYSIYRTVYNRYCGTNSESLKNQFLYALQVCSCGNLLNFTSVIKQTDRLIRLPETAIQACAHFLAWLLLALALLSMIGERTGIFSIVNFPQCKVGRRAGGREDRPSPCRPAGTLVFITLRTPVASWGGGAGALPGNSDCFQTSTHSADFSHIHMHVQLHLNSRTDTQTHEFLIPS